MVRLVGIAAAAVLAVQVLLAWRGLTSRKATALWIGFVAFAGALMGAVATRAAYSPLELFRIDVEIEATPERRWSYLCYVAHGPDGVVIPETGWTPLFYRAAGDPWWSGPDRKMEIEAGVMRLFLARDPLDEAPAGLEDGLAAADLRELAQRLRPPGDWEVTISGWDRDTVRIRRSARISFRPRN